MVKMVNKRRTRTQVPRSPVERTGVDGSGWRVTYVGERVRGSFGNEWKSCVGYTSTHRKQVVLEQFTEDAYSIPLQPATQ